MKIRSGFVSNSSSSSFCILGMVFNEESLSTIYNEIYGNTENRDRYEIVENLLENKDKSSQLDYAHGIEEYSEQVIIGVSPYELEENKTIKEHKIVIAKELSKLLEKEIKADDISFHTDGGRDG